MVRCFKPERLELPPNSNSAPRIWHWFKTFQNFTLAIKAEEDDKWKLSNQPRISYELLTFR